MSIYKIDSSSDNDDIKKFYHLYVEAFNDLCVWKENLIVDLGEYIKPSKNIGVFLDDIDFLTRALGIIIYYSHNDKVVTSIAFVDEDNISDCFVTVKYLCGNQSTKGEKINGKSQGINMLDFIFKAYKNNVILIEPATKELIPYYTNYKQPQFPYNELGLRETFGFLIYGDLSKLSEICFEKIFRSVKTIISLVRILHFSSINDLYSNTNNVGNLKDKLVAKLEHLIKTKQIQSNYYDQIINKIKVIQYYDISEIIVEYVEYNSYILQNDSIKTNTKSGGKHVNKNQTNKNKSNKNKTKKIKPKK